MGLYEWHTVVLARNQRKGNLIIDGQPPATGLSKGSSTGLNLNQALYVGGVPDFSAISTLAGFNSGFIGCLSYLAVNGKVTNLGKIMIVLFEGHFKSVVNFPRINFVLTFIEYHAKAKKVRKQRHESFSLIENSQVAMRSRGLFYIYGPFATPCVLMITLTFSYFVATIRPTDK